MSDPDPKDFTVPYTGQVVIKVKKLAKVAIVPKHAYANDAGVDLHSVLGYVLYPGRKKLIQTGIAIEMPRGYAGFILPRSGLAATNGISIVNSPGLVDSGYRGEILVNLINHHLDKIFFISVGDRIAQLVIQKIERPLFEEVDELKDSSRGEKGCGSSGV